MANPAFPPPFRPDGVLLAVSLVAEDVEALWAQAVTAAESRADLVEWRLDAFSADESTLAVTGRMLQERLGKPLLLTCRSRAEGGILPLAPDRRAARLVHLLEAGVGVLVDVEVDGEAEVVAAVDRAAKARGVPVIGSKHCFDGTPPVEVMVDILLRIEALGYIPKLAVTAHNPADAARLLLATAIVRERIAGPCITMAMRDAGRVTRLVGGCFGSALTFAALARPSAPGQLPLESVRHFLDLLATLSPIDAPEHPEGT